MTTATRQLNYPASNAPIPDPINGQRPTVCADCGTALPAWQKGDVTTGYALTAVPRIPFPAPARQRVLFGTECRGTVEHDASRVDGYGFRYFPSVYDVEGDDLAERTDMRAICFACSAVLERETMVARGRTCLYLSRKATAPKEVPHPRQRQQATISEPGDWWQVSGWPGVPTMPIIGSVLRSWGYGFGRRYPVETCRFKGPDGFVWSLRCAGDMQLARCRRTKDRCR